MSDFISLRDRLLITEYLISLGVRDSPKHPNFHQADRYLIRPIAVEPTSDGVAAVVSTLIILPGGSSAPLRITLGSSLVSLKGSQQALTNFTGSGGSNVAAFNEKLRVARHRLRAHF